MPAEAGIQASRILAFAGMTEEKSVKRLECQFIIPFVFLGMRIEDLKGFGLCG